MADDQFDPHSQQMLAYLRRIWPQWETAARLAQEAGIDDGRQHIDALLAAEMIEQMEWRGDEKQYRAIRQP
jgi:hypothetical protein